MQKEASHVGRRVVALHGGGRALQEFLFFLYIHAFNFPPVFPLSRLSSACFLSEESRTPALGPCLSLPRWPGGHGKATRFPQGHPPCTPSAPGGCSEPWPRRALHREQHAKLWVPGEQHQELQAQARGAAARGAPAAEHLALRSPGRAAGTPAPSSARAARGAQGPLTCLSQVPELGLFSI